jgi:hypothetical protein
MRALSVANLTDADGALGGPLSMSAFDAVDGSIHRHIGAMAVGCG